MAPKRKAKGNPTGSKAPPAKKGVSPAITQLRNRATQLGIDLDPSWTEGQLREVLDDWLDGLEDGIRVLGWANKSWTIPKSYTKLKGKPIGKINLSDRGETENRWATRRAADAAQDAKYAVLNEVNPFKRTIKGATDLTAEQLKFVADLVRAELVAFLTPRGVDIEGLSVGGLADSYRGYGTQDLLERDRQVLEERCRERELDHRGTDDELQKRLLIYDVTVMGALYDWDQKQVDAAISAMVKFTKPELTEEQKAVKEERRKEREKKGKAQKLRTKRMGVQRILSRQGTLTINIGAWRRTFDQLDVSGSQARCMWRAIAHVWLGDQDSWNKIYDRAMVLWDAVVNPPEGTTNPARPTREGLYGDFAAQTTWLDNLEDASWGDADTAQLVADTLDIQIFMYSPEVTIGDSPSGSTSDTAWSVQVRGRDHAAARQVHIVNYNEMVHWTALTDPGDADGDAAPGPPVADPSIATAAVYGLGALAPVLRLPDGHHGNTDLRDATVSGRVADTREVAKGDGDGGVGSKEDEEGSDGDGEDGEGSEPDRDEKGSEGVEDGDDATGSKGKEGAIEDEEGAPGDGKGGDEAGTKHDDEEAAAATQRVTRSKAPHLLPSAVQ